MAFTRFSERSLTPERKEPLLWGLDLGLPVGKAVVDIHWAPTTHKSMAEHLTCIVSTELPEPCEGEYYDYYFCNSEDTEAPGFQVAIIFTLDKTL